MILLVLIAIATILLHNHVNTSSYIIMIAHKDVIVGHVPKLINRQLFFSLKGFNLSEPYQYQSDLGNSVITNST